MIIDRNQFSDIEVVNVSLTVLRKIIEKQNIFLVNMKKKIMTLGEPFRI